MEIEYDVLKEEVIQFLDKHKILFLATSADDRVTARAMSCVHMGLEIYFQTGKKSAKFAQLVHDLSVEALVAVGLQDSRHQLFLAVVARGVAHHALVLAQLLFQQQRVLPLEGGPGKGALRGFGLQGGFGGRHGRLLAGRNR